MIHAYLKERGKEQARPIHLSELLELSDGEIRNHEVILTSGEFWETFPLSKKLIFILNSNDGKPARLFTIRKTQSSEEFLRNLQSYMKKGVLCAG